MINSDDQFRVVDDDEDMLTQEAVMVILARRLAEKFASPTHTIDVVPIYDPINSETQWVIGIGASNDDDNPIVIFDLA